LITSTLIGDRAEAPALMIALHGSEVIAFSQPKVTNQLI
jgi:hypothetical protein